MPGSLSALRDTPRPYGKTQANLVSSFFQRSLPPPTHREGRGCKPVPLCNTPVGAAFFGPNETTMLICRSGYQFSWAWELVESTRGEPWQSVYGGSSLVDASFPEVVFGSYDEVTLYWKQLIEPETPPHVLVKRTRR